MNPIGFRGAGLLLRKNDDLRAVETGIPAKNGGMEAGVVWCLF